jgi:hypothetical protein
MRNFTIFTKALAPFFDEDGTEGITRIGIKIFSPKRCRNHYAHHPILSRFGRGGQIRPARFGPVGPVDGSPFMMVTSRPRSPRRPYLAVGAPPGVIPPCRDGPWLLTPLAPVKGEAVLDRDLGA